MLSCPLRTASFRVEIYLVIEKKRYKGDKGLDKQAATMHTAWPLFGLVELGCLGRLPLSSFILRKLVQVGLTFSGFYSLLSLPNLYLL